MADLRPLDRLRTLKVKLGVLVGASCVATAIVTWLGLAHLGVLRRYSLPVAVLVALGVTQLLARGMISPLRELTAAAQAMARGDYTRRVKATSRDEVGDAARAFNQMAADLAQVDRQRRELVANVSHELRTPISAMQAMLENVVDGVTPSDPQTLRVILEQVERLGRLVNELLDLSRVDAGNGPVLTRTEVHLQALIDSLICEASMGPRRVRYVAVVEPEGATAWLDEQRVHQVVANLLDNASRHSPTNGVIRVHVTARADSLRLSVTDEGPGIPEGERERVFERFTRGGGSAADGGTGLGLAIARWAVDLHGGRIQVADSASGCRIDVILPKDGPQ